MSFFGNVFDFEKFNLKDMGRKIKEDPKRLLLGVDQGSTMAWNKILGKDDEPITNWGGGPTGGAYARAGQQGVPTNEGHKMHDLAEIVAGLFVGNKAASAMGNGSNGNAGWQGHGQMPGGGNNNFMSQAMRNYKHQPTTLDKNGPSSSSPLIETAPTTNPGTPQKENGMDIDPLVLQELLSLGAENSDLDGQVAQKQMMAKQMRVMSAGGPGDTKMLGRVAVAPHWTQMLGGMAQQGAAMKNDQAAGQMQKQQSQNKHMQNQRLIEILMKMQQGNQIPQPQQQMPQQGGADPYSMFSYGSST